MALGFCQSQRLHSQGLVDIVVDEHQGTSLTDLRLTHIPCHCLHFSRSATLTALKLKGVHQCSRHMTCYMSLQLPENLQSLEVLFTCSESSLDLERHADLTRLDVLNIDVFRKSRLPSSLLHFTFRGAWRGDSPIWDCLQPCTNLEYLILPYSEYIKINAVLKAWIAGARHLHVIDYVT